VWGMLLYIIVCFLDRALASGANVCIDDVGAF